MRLAPIRVTTRPVLEPLIRPFPDGHKEVIPLKNLHNLSTFLFILSIVSFPIAVAYAAEDSSKADTSLESKLEQLMTSVYCHCGCTRETIRQCVCGVAQQIESKFRGRLAAGQTVEQLRNEYIATYGTQYSAVMLAEGFNIVAYVMPAVIILLLGVGVFLVLKLKSRSSLAPQPAATEQQPATLTDRYKQIEKELELYKQQR